MDSRVANSVKAIISPDVINAYKSHKHKVQTGYLGTASPLWVLLIDHAKNILYLLMALVLQDTKYLHVKH